MHDVKTHKKDAYLSFFIALAFHLA